MKKIIRINSFAILILVFLVSFSNIVNPNLIIGGWEYNNFQFSPSLDSLLKSDTLYRKKMSASNERIKSWKIRFLENGNYSFSSMNRGNVFTSFGKYKFKEDGTLLILKQKKDMNFNSQTFYFELISLSNDTLKFAFLKDIIITMSRNKQN